MKQPYRLIAVLVALSASVAWANPVSVDYLGLEKKTKNVDLPGFVNNIPTGLMKFEKNSGSELPFNDGERFLAFCIDLHESISSSRNPQYYEAVNPALAPNSGVMGTARADILGAWFGQFWLGHDVADWTAPQATAFQLGVWEIVNEDFAGIGSVNSGVFRLDASGSSSGAVDAALLSDQWFQSFNPQGDRLELIALSSPYGDACKRIQDVVTAVPPSIPEPGTLLLIGGGTLLYLRRKPRRAA